MRRMQHRVLLHVMSLRLHGPTLLLRHPVLPRNLAMQGSTKGGEARRGSTPLLLHNCIPSGFSFLSAPAWGDYATLFCDTHLKVFLYRVRSLYECKNMWFNMHYPPWWAKPKTSRKHMYHSPNVTQRNVLWGLTTQQFINKLIIKA
jgi:hypothetical protein